MAQNAWLSVGGMDQNNEDDEDKDHDEEEKEDSVSNQNICLLSVSDDQYTNPNKYYPLL